MKTKKLVSLLLTLCMLLSVVPMMGITASAATAIEGTDIEWEYNSNKRTLTITGSGEIPSYATGEAPWNNKKPIKITIGEGITGIGERAFTGITSTQVAVHLPSTIKKIENQAFSGIAISTLYLSPKTGKSLVIKSDAFDNCQSFVISFSDKSTVGENFKIVKNVLYTSDGKEIVCIPTKLQKAITPSSEVEKIPNSLMVSFEGFFSSTNIDEDLTVDVISFKDGTSSDSYHVGELLEAKVTSKSGKSTEDLYYGWVKLSKDNGDIDVTGYANYISGFDNSDLSDSDEIQFSKTARWASTKGAHIIGKDTTYYFALVVCRKDDNGNYDIVGKRQFTVSSVTSGYGGLDSLKHCVKSNTVTMFKGETLSLQQLLKRCGITHTTCPCTTINNVATTGTEYLTVSGYNITACKVGWNIPVTFDFSSESCTYHSDKSSITSEGNTLTINVIDPVELKSDCGGFAITNPVSGYDYTIGNQKGTLSDDGKIVFDNLTENTDYTLKLTLTGKYGAASAQVTEKVTTGSFEHTYSSDWTYDRTQHWHAATCAHETEKTGAADHTGMEDGICDVCGYKIPNVSKEVETEDSSITVSDESNTAIQNYVDSQESSLIYDTKYKFAVKEQTPDDNAKKTAIEEKAGTNRTVTFFEATFTKTETIDNVAQTPVEITDTGDTVLSFTIAYDMTGRCNLGVFRYHGEEATELTRVYTTANPKDGTYYVEGSGANTKVTVFASKFSAYGAGSSLIPEALTKAKYNASLTLDADIDLTFTMGSLGTDGNGTGFVQSKLKITVDGTEWTNYKVKDGELSGVLKEVVPKDIGTDLHIVITYDGIVIKDFNYSVKAYCEAVFKAQTADKQANANDTTYDKLADLCEALLNYGKYVADYVNSDTASTLNENHVKNFSDYTISDVTDGVINGTAGEANLSLGSTITLKYYVKTDEALTNTDSKTQNFFVLNGKGEQIDPNRVTFEKVTGNNKYNYIVSIDLYASQLATQYTLKLKGVSTDDFCITYGVYNYCSAAQNQNGFSDTLKTLCKAIHNYSVAVQAYIDSPAQ